MFRNKFHIAVVLAFAPVLAAENVPGRYIVELTREPVAVRVTRLSPRGGMKSATASTHRALVRAEQVEARRRLEQRQYRVLDGVDTVANALFVEAPDGSAATLAAMPGVKRVAPVRMMHMVLDRAVLLHKVADVWNQVGSDKAGAGVKIAIIDSGIDSTHPGFQDPSLATPDSFPRVNSASDLAYTNQKIIVARSYVNLLPRRDPDASARDRVGHGTALAMIAAGATNTGPLATITGVAPSAWLGNYKVFGTPGYNDGASDDAVLKAIDDAVADGMDIISLSLGDDLAPRLSDDLDVQAVERASAAGVIVVVAAGNNGPDLNTISSPATAPSAIAVGASANDRTFAAAVEIPGHATFVAMPGDGPAPSTVTAPISDVSTLDGSGLACSPLPAGSLRDRIALILRGACTFQTKLNNAQQAGAMAALIYAAEASPDPVPMAVGAATLPAEMIGYDDGLAIKQGLAAEPALAGTLRFTLGAVAVPANRLMQFSAAGPNVDASIKPDLVAVGGDVYTATQTLDERGEMYDPSGYVLVDGTSFSTPLVAGAAALLKSTRPGLTVDQYRSLLIDTAARPAELRSGQIPGVQQSGGGLLDAFAALNATVTAYPSSLSLGAGAPDAQISRALTITNVGSTAESFAIAAAPLRSDAPSPAVATGIAELAAGASMDIPVTWNAGGLAPGTYEGFISVTGTSSGTQIRVPYWYAVVSGSPATITILSSVASARRGSLQPDAILFRVTEGSGLVVPDVQPEASVISGGGVVRGIASHDTEVPGVFGLDVQLGAVPGPNVFRIQAGAVILEVEVTGQ